MVCFIDRLSIDAPPPTCTVRTSSGCHLICHFFMYWQCQNFTGSIQVEEEERITLITLIILLLLLVLLLKSYGYLAGKSKLVSDGAVERLKIAFGVKAHL